jgi:hypothetical protein
MIDNQHQNFYVVELKNEALFSIFNEDYNIRFFLAASNELSNDIEAICKTEEVVNKVKTIVGQTPTMVEKFNPAHFPTLNSELLMETDDNGMIHDIHPHVAKVTLVTLHDDSIIQARAIGVPTSEVKTLQ